MLRTIRGALIVVLITLNIVFWFIPIMLFAVVRLVLPFDAVRRFTSRVLSACGENWISGNGFLQDIATNTDWHITGVDALRRNDWYLLLANHQSWVDIVVLQYALNRKIPFLKFFIKSTLIWVPFLGLAWWAMDMPFMKRYSKSYLKKHPERKGKDLEATRRSCERFSEIPTSVINFVEGTRFSPEKHARRSSTYTNLLPPRAGGIAFALSVMGEQFRSMLDVTVVYPGGQKTFWDLVTGRIKHIVVDVREISIEPWMREGDYSNDREFRARFHTWLATLWAEKDARFDQLMAEHASATERAQ